MREREIAETSGRGIAQAAIEKHEQGCKGKIGNENNGAR
jgi:hypothetical protein